MLTWLNIIGGQNSDIGLILFLEKKNSSQLTFVNFPNNKQFVIKASWCGQSMFVTIYGRLVDYI
jgi:hypothetical protein